MENPNNKDYHVDEQNKIYILGGKKNERQKEALNSGIKVSLKKSKLQNRFIK